MKAHRHAQAMLATVGLVVATVLTACASHPRGGAPQSTHAGTVHYAGTYTGPEGQRIGVTPHGTGFQLEVNRNGQTRSYGGYVLSIDGVSVWEIVLAEPDQAVDEQGRAVLPAYTYFRTERRDGDVLVRRLRTEWLELQSRETGITAFGKTPEIGEGAAAVVARDPQAMEAMLRRAVKDPAAFGEPEVFRKVD